MKQWDACTGLQGDTFTIFMFTAMLTAVLSYTWVCVLFRGNSCLKVTFHIPCSWPILMFYSKAKQKAQTVALLWPTVGHLPDVCNFEFWPDKNKAKHLARVGS